MLHEMAHIVVGPHNDEFQALWTQLRKEYDALVMKGYTGEGFLSDGHRLGGRRLPRHEARRLARVAAEKRQSHQMYTGTGAGDDGSGGRRLGGSAIGRGQDPRRVIAKAAEKRKKTMEGCAGSRNKSQKQMERLADQATRNGVSTKGSIDEEEEEAIQQALWDMIQEEQMREYGDSYIESTPTNPAGNGGGLRTRADIAPGIPRSEFGDKSGSQRQSSNSSRSNGSSSRPSTSHTPRSSSSSSRASSNQTPASSSRPPSNSSTSRHPPSSTNCPYASRPAPLPSANSRQPPNKPVSRLVLEAEAQQRQRKTPNRTTSKDSHMPISTPSTTPAPVSTPATSPHSPPPYSAPGWTCPLCTLHNPISYLACDACATERPMEVTKKLAAEIETYGTRSGRTLGGLAGIGRGKELSKGMWRCTGCGIQMESMWWTCSGCGRMKESS